MLSGAVGCATAGRRRILDRCQRRAPQGAARRQPVVSGIDVASFIPIAAGYATPTQGAGPMIITERAGLFEKHGLAVKTIDKRRAVGVVQGMMDGELQFGN